jgi:hypothetical protein
MNMPKKKSESLTIKSVSVELIEQNIYLIRGHKVMLDSDLAELYGVTTKRLNEQVKRNQGRFPGDFMFQLTRQEADRLNRSQIATGSQRHRNPRHKPYAFTEHGAVMLASVLSTPIAVEASIRVVRAFVRLRSILVEHKDLARKIKALEKSYRAQSQRYDAQFNAVFDAIRKLMEPPPARAARRIGFS